MQRVTHEFKCDLPSSFFTKTAAGEYCSACKTVVIDFTGKTNEEILAILSANNGHACGSAYSDQFTEETSSQKLRNKFAVAGLAALLSLAPAAKAESTDAVKTEVVAQEPYISTFDAVPVAENVAQTPAIESPDKPSTKRETVKRKTFLRIGHRHFYTMNVFPFIGSRKIRKGRYSNVSDRW